MDTVQMSSNSAFSEMVDKLRNKSEEELKLLYLKFFSNELNDEWKEITKESNFNNTSDHEIIRAIQKQRYRN